MDSNTLLSFSQMRRDVLHALNPARYLESLGFAPYEWQRFVLDMVSSGRTRIIINGARQGGKSTIVSGLPAHKARFRTGTLSLILAPSERQSMDTISKVRDFVSLDLGAVVEDLGRDHLSLAGGGRILALPATEKTIRGKSSPRLVILDEMSRVPDELYKGIRPMFVDNPLAALILISTPWGKRGQFHETWTARDDRWIRVEVKAPWDIVRGDEGTPVLVEAEPEESYRARRLAEGIHAFYSPRHRDREFMQEELGIIGERWFRQEYLCEFVEAEGSAFVYEDIAAAFDARIAPLGGSLVGTVGPLFATA